MQKGDHGKATKLDIHHALPRKARRFNLQQPYIIECLSADCRRLVSIVPASVLFSLPSWATSVEPLREDLVINPDILPPFSTTKFGTQSGPRSGPYRRTKVEEESYSYQVLSWAICSHNQKNQGGTPRAVTLIWYGTCF